MIGRPKRGKWHKVTPSEQFPMDHAYLACNEAHVYVGTTFESAEEYEKTTGNQIYPGWVCRHRVCRLEVDR